jgi:hypothetical protein
MKPTNGQMVLITTLSIDMPAWSPAIADERLPTQLVDGVASRLGAGHRL